MSKPGDKVKVWVYLKKRGVFLDETPHLINTIHINSFQTWFSRDVKSAICGKTRRNNEAWRQVDKYNSLKSRPDNACETCLRIDLMTELGE